MTQAAAVGLNAGLDMEGGGPSAIDQLPAAIAANMTNAAAVAQALRRLFLLRIRLGMFDPPTFVPYNSIPQSVAGNARHLALALESAEKGMTLLYNPASTLPLHASTLRQAPGSAVLIGPQWNMSGLLVGNHAENPSLHGWPQSLLGAFQSSHYLHNSAAYVQGCDDIECNQTDFSAAVAAASRPEVQVVIVTLGLRFNQFCHRPNDSACEAEGFDRSAIELPGNQAGLVLALRNALGPSKRLVGLLIHGGTLSLDSTLSSFDAVLSAWYPGLMGAPGAAAVVFGRVSPAGRTAVTWYRATADLGPMGETDLYAGNGTTYRFFKGRPLFPFGHGLSYTQFSYSGLSANVNGQPVSSTIDPCDVVELIVSVSNIGKVDSDEVVQVYARQPQATVPVPSVRLVDFARVFVRAGEIAQVVLRVNPRTHAAVRSDGNDIYHGSHIVWVERGPLQLYVGGGQPGYVDTVNTTLMVASDCLLSTCMQPS
jgi:beta-glucosidase